MTTVEQTLLILIAAGFLILLTIAIVIAILVLKIVRHAQGIAQNIESASGNLGETMRLVRTKVAPLAGTSLLGLVFNTLKQRKHRKEGSDE